MARDLLLLSVKFVCLFGNYSWGGIYSNKITLKEGTNEYSSVVIPETITLTLKCFYNVIDHVHNRTA